MPRSARCRTEAEFYSRFGQFTSPGLLSAEGFRDVVLLRIHEVSLMGKARDLEPHVVTGATSGALMQPQRTRRAQRFHRENSLTQHGWRKHPRGSSRRATDCREGNIVEARRSE